jgi:hypothetical protein
VFELRDDHMAAFQEVSLEDFAYRAEEYLRSAYPAEAESLTPEALRARVMECVDRAEKYGLELEEHIVDFVAATLVLGKAFDGDSGQESAREILTHPGWSPGRKHLELGRVVEAARSKVTR